MPGKSNKSIITTRVKFMNDNIKLSYVQFGTPKIKSCHDAKFVVICGTMSRHDDNLRCHQWRQIWHQDNIKFKMSVIVGHHCLRTTTSLDPESHPAGQRSFRQAICQDQISHSS